MSRLLMRKLTVYFLPNNVERFNSTSSFPQLLYNITKYFSVWGIPRLSSPLVLRPRSNALLVDYSVILSLMAEYVYCVKN